MSEVEEELADLRAAIDFVIEHNPSLDRPGMMERTFAKCNLFDRWHQRATEG